MTEIYLTPEEISAHRFFSRGEKLDWLGDLKFELELESIRGVTALDQIEARMASIEQAISRVKCGTVSGCEPWHGDDGAAHERTANG